MHIFGPRERFALAADVAYAPAEAPAEAYREIRRRLGLTRVVVVQPSLYGTDNACTLEAIAQLAPQARGIAAVEPSISDEELARLHAAGIRGLRFSLTVKNAMRPEHLEPMARRIHPLGWHIQFRSTHRDLPEVAPRLHALPVDVCLDHMSSIPPEVPLTHPAWRALFRLLDGGRCWVKLSAPYQLSRMPGPRYDDLRPPGGRAGPGGPGADGLGDELAPPHGGDEARRCEPPGVARGMGDERVAPPDDPGRQSRQTVRLPSLSFPRLTLFTGYGKTRPPCAAPGSRRIDHRGG
jgi:D-galactarolactone isomerase